MKKRRRIPKVIANRVFFFIAGLSANCNLVIIKHPYAKKVSRGLPNAVE